MLKLKDTKELKSHLRGRVDRDGTTQREMEYWSPNMTLEMAALCSALAMEMRSYATFKHQDWVGGIELTKCIASSEKMQS